MANLLFLIPLLPFAGFLVNGLLGRRLPAVAVSLIACLAPALAFVAALLGFVEVAGGEVLSSDLGNWIEVGNLTISFGFLLDRLSAVMALVVTGVGTLIHVYSCGYMKGDPGYARYFAYLNLFMAAMLVLVLADNIVFLFLGWEGVGLCSYLLIGFWYKDLRNCSAGIKAFIVNRIGDLGFLLGIFWLFVIFKTVDFQSINDAVAGVTGEHSTALFWIALLLFVGAAGKSAQIPLYIWLPDAMAGPTPVSALIHAATMVTSGVYMMARLGPLYSAVPDAGVIVAAVGAATALLAALIALSQTDIKKVLAYSTISQLGYMFLAAGIGAYGIAIFHLVTHSFFKALLFLAAGAVIHALDHEQDMRRMGGLWRKIPHSFGLFTVGALALAGFPLTAGFFSKDEILHAAHSEQRTLLWGIGLATALLTAFYIFRQVYLVFLGEYRGKGARTETDDAGAGHGLPDLEKVHDSPLVMRLPLYVLAFLSLIGGALAVPHFLEAPGGLRESALAREGQLAGWLLGGALAIAGIAAALLLYWKGRALLELWAVRMPPGRALTGLSYRKFYVDELYDFLIVKPLYVVSEILFWLVDTALIDFLLVRGSGHLVRFFGFVLRRLQTGRVPSYALWFLCGVLGVLALSLWL